MLDQSGAALIGAALELMNTSQQTTYRTISDDRGIYSFPNLPVGQYDLSVAASGFRPQRKAAIKVDTDSAIRVDVTLVVGVAVGYGHHDEHFAYAS